MVRSAAWVLGLAGFLVLATSCGDPNATPMDHPTSVGLEIPGTVKAKVPITWDIGKPGGTWYAAFSDDVRSYNPFSNLDGSYTTVTDMICDGLFDYEASTRQWKGYMFEDYKVDSDAGKDTMVLTARLHPGMRWSDGHPMTADDIAWWYNELRSDDEIYPRGAQTSWVVMADGSKKKIRAQAVDERTVQWVYPRVIANPMLIINDNEVVPRHIWEPVKKKGKAAVWDFWNIKTDPKDLVTCGPFVLERYIPGERLVFKRNPYYWQKDEKGNQLPYVEQVIYSLVRETNAQLLKFQNGELDSYGIRGKDMATLLPGVGEKTYAIWNLGPAGTYSGAMLNLKPDKISKAKHQLFSDIRFRQAISSLLDRQSIIDKLISGLAVPWNQLVAENNRHYNEKIVNPYSFNLEKAKSLFAEIGLKDRNGDGLLEDLDGQPLTIICTVGDEDPTEAQIVNIFVTEAKKAGLDCRVETLARSAIVQKIMFNFEWDLMIRGFSFPTFQEQWSNVWPSEGDLHYWDPKQTKPRTEWEARLDTVNFTLRYTYDDVKAKQLYDEFQTILVNNLPIIPMYRKYSFAAVAAKWANVNVDAYHDVGDGLRRIYLK